MEFTLADFEIIEIIGDTRPYPALLGIDWAFDNKAVINLKKRQMTFEDNQVRVIAPLDPLQGPRYIELLKWKKRCITWRVYIIWLQIKVIISIPLQMEILAGDAIAHAHQILMLA